MEALTNAAQHVSRVGTLEEDLHVCFFRHRMLVAYHAKNGKEDTVFAIASSVAATTQASTHTGRTQMKAQILSLLTF